MTNFIFTFITIDENWYKFTKDSRQRGLSKLFNILRDNQILTLKI